MNDRATAVGTGLGRRAGQVDRDGQVTRGRSGRTSWAEQGEELTSETASEEVVRNDVDGRVEQNEEVADLCKEREKPTNCGTKAADVLNKFAIR